MRRAEDFPMEPEVQTALSAVDATLAGEPVAPRHAELAELALLLRDERPRINPGFANRLDARVELRFAPARRAGIDLADPGGDVRRRWPRPWIWAPAAALVASLAIAVVIVASQGGGGSATGSNAVSGTLELRGAPRAHMAPVPAPSRQRINAQARPHVLAKRPNTPTQADSAVSAAPSLEFAPAGPMAPGSLQPPSSGRKVTRGGQLQLSTSPKRIDQVAQELFDVVGQEHGIVESSYVTAGGGQSGNAQFQLSIPTSRLTQAMTSLSTLPHTRVQSRTDTTQDVTNTYEADRRRLADARALRASLVKQLAAATTQGEIDSLTTRIHSAEAAISSAEKALHLLNHQTAYSQVFVTLNGGFRPGPVHHGGGGFGLGRAAHDAGHVLTVAAGVALIALAGLLPVALLAALGWWIWLRVRQRRRRQALDMI